MAIENGDRYKNRKGTRRVYPLSGILKHEDGSYYTGELGVKGKVYYYNRKNKKRVDAVALEDAVIESFNVFENETSMSAIVRELVSKKNERLEIVDGEIINVQKEIEELNVEIQGYIKSVAQIGSDEKFKEIVEEISLNIGKSKKEQSELKEKLEAMQLKRDNIRSESLECRPLKEIMKVVFKKLKASSNEMKKNILKNLCSEIKILSGNQVEIKWMPEVCGLGGQFVDLREKWGAQPTL